MKRFFSAAQDLNFVILYGSQLGQAKSIAEGLADTAEQYGLNTRAFPLNEVQDLSELKNLDKPVVIVTSTTGDGDPPENADKFWRKLRRKTLDNKTLLCLRYTILGLGDTNYNNFCNCGKTVHQRFQELGATLFYAPGWADDAVGIELVVDDWIQGLWPAVKRACGVSKVSTSFSLDTSVIQETVKSAYQEMMETSNGVVGADPTKLSEPAAKKLSVPALPVTSLRVALTPPVGAESYDLLNPATAYPLIEDSPYKAKVIDVNILTKPGALKMTLEITLRVEKELKFLPGDAVSVICPNNSAEVTALLRRLKLDEAENSTAGISLTENPKVKIPAHLPAKASVKDFFTHICDIRQPPKKVFLRVLAEYTTDDEEKSSVLELSSKEGASRYASEILEPGVSILDFLMTYQSCQPPLHILLEHLPRLTPRPYSICSSPLASEQEFKFAFNIIQIPKEGKRRYSRLGVCTGYLLSICKALFPQKFEDQNGVISLEDEFSLSLDENHELLVYKRKNQLFHPPPESDKPVIMVGPGTGVAPFIGFLQHRQLRTKAEPSIEWGSYVLYFGCRTRSYDYLYEAELANFVEKNALTNLHIAFSRDANDNGPKYVQDLMLQNMEQLVSHLESGGYFYVCGDAKNMAKDVRECLIKCYELVKGVDSKNAMSLVSNLVSSKRYLQDVWA